MERRKRRGRERERVEGNAFMDVARDAFVRHLALEKWREIEDLKETLGLDLAGAIEEAGQFSTRAPYQALWEARWKQEVCAAQGAEEAGTLFASIERAVALALSDEEAERERRGAPPLAEDREYLAFVGSVLGNLQRQAGAELGPS
jgi:hypothetical protein